MKKQIAGIEVELQKKKVKHLRLTVSALDGSVRVSAPWFVGDGEIEAFVASKRDWILSHQARAWEQKRLTEPTDCAGERIALFGKNYLLSVQSVDKNFGVTLLEEEILLCIPEACTSEKKAAMLKDWQRAYLAQCAAPLFAKWEKITGLYSSGWQIRDMKTRWGSCTPKTGRIRLSLRLVGLPIECLEYVILHELAHLRISGHGRDFYSLISSYMPDYRERVRKMKDRR